MSGPRVQSYPRADDDQELRLLRLRVIGDRTDTYIASATGLSRNAIIGRRHRIMTADIAESGEPEEYVRACYARGAGC